MSHDDTQSRLLDAAGEVFCECGFQAATIREICGKAGVNIAAVNYHYGDKHGLYVEALRHAHRMREQQVPLPDWPPGTPAAQRLRDFIATMMQRFVGLEGKPWHWKLMMREVLQPSDACRDLVEDYIRPHFELLLSILDDLVPADTPKDKRQKLAFSVVGQCLFYRFNAEIIRMLMPDDEVEEHFAPESLAEHIADVMAATLACRPYFEEQTT